jgi:predicted DNA-binding protein
MKYATSFRLSAEAIRLLKALAEAKGVSQASVIEMILRDAAKREKLDTK